MITAGITLYYTDYHALAELSVKDFVLVEEGEKEDKKEGKEEGKTQLVFRWVRNNDGHSFTNAIITWEKGEVGNFADFWSGKVKERIRQERILRLSLEGEVVEARTEPDRTTASGSCLEN